MSGKLDLDMYTWESTAPMFSGEVEYTCGFIVNCDQGGFNASVRVTTVLLNGYDNITGHLTNDSFKEIEEDILEAITTLPDAYYKRHAANDLPDSDDVRDYPGEGYSGAVT